MVVGRMSDSDDLEVAKDLLNQADGLQEQGKIPRPTLCTVELLRLGRRSLAPTTRILQRGSTTGRGCWRGRASMTRLGLCTGARWLSASNSTVVTTLMSLQTSTTWRDCSIGRCEDEIEATACDSGRSPQTCEQDRGSLRKIGSSVAVTVVWNSYCISR
ncbi:unnamed protein product [Ectocarpus sp. 8 AP-2014]